jgi:glucan phosphoethanolaminetransferase (alkaline phosphatase superfamily)
VHIQNKFLFLLGLAFITTGLDSQSIIAVFVVVTFIAIALSRITFFSMLRRVKWLLIFMLIIYAYSTPGEYFYYWPTNTRPTYEGLLSGLIHAMRLITMLAGLSCILGTTTKQVLVGGLYQLACPLRWLNFDAQRLALRVALTLNYVDVQQFSRHAQNSWRDMLSQLSSEVGSTNKSPELANVVIDVEPMRSIDLVVMILFIVMLLWVIY